VKIFVSGKLGSESRVNEAMELVRERGHEVTFDWTTIRHLRPYEENTEESSVAALLEVSGVRDADILLSLVDDRGIGLFVELGVALALDKPILAVYSGPMRSMFLAHPLVKHFTDLADAVDYIG
jgi:nucleoside 2-deoxyribosyltransferase